MTRHTLYSLSSLRTRSTIDMTAFCKNIFNSNLANSQLMASWRSLQRFCRLHMPCPSVSTYLCLSVCLSVSMYVAIICIHKDKAQDVYMYVSVYLYFA